MKNPGFLWRMILVGVGAVSLPVLTKPLALSAQAQQTQQTSGTALPSFEVASIKPDNAPGMGMIGGDPGTYSATRMSVEFLIMTAFKVKPFQISGGPKWVQSQRFDIEAKTDDATAEKMAAMSRAESFAQTRLMLQSLLADRFKLAVHFDVRQLPVFALVLDKPGAMGPHLRLHTEGPACDAASPASGNSSAADAADLAFPTCDGFKTSATPGHLDLRARNVPLEWLVASLPAVGNLDRPVENQTGLTGRFDFRMKFNGSMGAAPGIQPDESGPTFLEALHDQLGLKLEPTKGPVDVLVIDHIEEPTPN
jgi:uncharacterized protein (TIGR03435 family)